MNAIASPASPTQPRPASHGLLDSFPAASLEQRKEMFEALVRDPSPEIRTQILRIGATILPDDRLVEFLRRDDDAVLRNAGLEILKLRGQRAVDLALSLLDDPDEDVVLQAILILDAARDPRALEPLRRMLGHEDLNLCQAAITAVGHLGSADALDDLLPFLDRKPWLRLAAVEALGQLRSPAAVGPLSEQLTDLMVGDSAAEALARIGGPTAFDALAEHWLRFHDELDPAELLEYLAHVAEGLAPPPPSPPGFADSLKSPLLGDNGRASLAAARLVLATGREPLQEEALARLAQTPQDAATLPAALRHRADLTEPLLERGGVYATWGLLLAAHSPGPTDEDVLVRAVQGLEADGLATLLTALGALLRLESERLDRALLGFALRLPTYQLAQMGSALSEARERILRQLEVDTPAHRVQELILRAELGQEGEAWRRTLLDLPPEHRLAVVEVLGHGHDLVLELPWARWLRDEPDRYAAAAAEAARHGGFTEMLPDLRHCLSRRPAAEIVRCLGELRDEEGVELLEKLLESRPDLAPVILDSLGRIGGDAARRVLRRQLDEAAGHREDLLRPAFRALSRCAVAGDEDRFRQATAHPDWHVRLAAAEALGRFGQEEANRTHLARLAADPVPVVAQQALATLES